MKITKDILHKNKTLNTQMQRRLWSLMPEKLARDSGARMQDIGGGLLTMMTKSTALDVNRVLGLGVEDLVREPVIDEIANVYRAAKLKRFCIFVSPPRQDAIVGWLKARDFAYIGSHVRLFASTTNTTSPQTD